MRRQQWPAVLADTFDGRRFLNDSGNFGGYNEQRVNALIDRALGAETPQQARAAWIGVASEAMRDAAIVPLIQTKSAWFHSGRVRHRIPDVTLIGCSLNSLWLSDAGNN